jgi:hypothetical protein
LYFGSTNVGSCIVFTSVSWSMIIKMRLRGLVSLVESIFLGISLIWKRHGDAGCPERAGDRIFLLDKDHSPT